MHGLGIEDSALMTDSVDTWEELTVSGTADVTGVVEVWVEGCRNEYDANGGDAFLTPKHPGTINIYADKLVIEYS